MSRLKERGLRESFNIIAVLLMVMVSVALTGMVFSEREQRRLARDLNRVYQTVVLADHIERDLLQLQLSHAQQAHLTEIGREQMDLFESRLLANMEEAASVVDSADEGEMFARLEQHVERTLAALKASREDGPGAPANRANANLRILETLPEADAFAQLNRDQARGDILKASRLRQGLFAMRVGLSVVLTALAIFVLRLSREHLRAVSGLGDAIRRFTLGKGWIRAPRSRVTELNEVGEEFNRVVDELERNHRERALFLSSVAHDLRTPLSALQSAVQLLSREPTLEGSQRRVKVIQRQLDRLNNMVSDFQDAAGVEAGNLKLHRTEADLRTVVNDAVELFRASTAQHDFECHLPETAVTLSFDETRIGQVLANLLSNAIKYSEGGRIRITLERDSEVRVAVSDEGEGISADELSSLFMPFQRLSRNAQLPGVGLGLSVSKRLVEAHGGRLEAQSVPGQGSTFLITLPLSGPEPRLTGGPGSPPERRTEGGAGALRH